MNISEAEPEAIAELFDKEAEEEEGEEAMED